jgi:hypothetical protein
MRVLSILAAALMFTSVLAGCLALVGLVILMVRFPPLLLAVVLACWRAGCSAIL